MTDSVRVLIVCGAPGTGKTVVAWEAGHQLQALGIPHAVIDTDELDRIWPRPEPAEALIEVTGENLRAVWRTFARLGLRHLVMCGVMASIPLNRAWIEDALNPAAITFVRLTAARPVRETRLRTREVGIGFERDMRASDEVSAFVKLHDPPEMPVLATDGRTVFHVVEEVLAIAGWFRWPDGTGEDQPG